MEDLAYLYLTLNAEVERAQRGFEAVPLPLPSAWVGPMPSDRAALPSTPSDRPQSSTMQSPDLDLDSLIYPSFYL
jgi:hypothetical protein